MKYVTNLANRDFVGMCPAGIVFEYIDLLEDPTEAERDCPMKWSCEECPCNKLRPTTTLEA